MIKNDKEDASDLLVTSVTQLLMGDSPGPKGRSSS